MNGLNLWPAAATVLVYALVGGFVGHLLDELAGDRISERLRLLIAVAWPVVAIAGAPMFCTWIGVQLAGAAARRIRGPVMVTIIGDPFDVDSPRRREERAQRIVGGGGVDNPPSCPTSLGEVWTGTTQPSVAALLEVARMRRMRRPRSPTSATTSVSRVVS